MAIAGKLITLEGGEGAADQDPAVGEHRQAEDRAGGARVESDVERAVGVEPGERGDAVGRG